MNRELNSPLGVCVLPEPEPNAPRTVRYSQYIHEILGHAGIPYARIDREQLAERVSGLRVLVTIGEADVPEDARRALEAWVRGGGCWLGIGGVCGMPGMFGVDVLPPSWTLRDLKTGTLGEGYLQPRGDVHRVLEHIEAQPGRSPGDGWLHFFNGIPVRAAGAQVLADVLDSHHRPTDRAALTENEVGSGACVLIAPDLTGAVVRIQQGIGVTRDGVAAPDGTACVDDRTGKTDDACVLDWLLDRQPLPEAEGFSAFLQPVADHWREVLLRSVLYLCEKAAARIPLLWLYPRNLPALGHVSHDTDNCEIPNAWGMLDAVASARINTTWCVILPGYPEDVFEAIRGAGHELATHYDAMSSGCPWGEAEFDATIQRLSRMMGEPKPVTNKNHYLRWEGDTEFFDWCAARGIRMDQSKGPSKSGNVGFAFGTCHPYFPVAADGRLIDVLELPTLTQDLLIVAPKELSGHLLEAALRCHGIGHFLFHPSHILKPGVADALRETAETGKRLGMEFWTARRINEWERARRSASWCGWSPSPSGAAYSLRTGDALAEATVMCLAGPAESITINGSRCETRPVERWGVTFATATIDLWQETDYYIEIEE